jgi:DNA ligase-1
MKKLMKPDNKPWHPTKVEKNLPLLAFQKIDGIRTGVDDGIAYSNSLKPLPNKQLQAFMQEFRTELQGWDMEVGVGSATDEFFFKQSHAFCMKADREAEFDLYVFDKWDEPDLEYIQRIELLEELQARYDVPRINVLPFRVISSMASLDCHFDEMIDGDEEGGIYRRPDALYKHGRATPNCGGMYKRKSRVDTEVTITGFNEAMENLNPKTTNEMGNSVRSSHKDNKVGKGTLGSFECSGFFEDGRPFTTKVGVFLGFTDEDKQAIWDRRDTLINKPMKIKYMGVGSDQSPRTPVALGFRDPIDMS